MIHRMHFNIEIVPTLHTEMTSNKEPSGGASGQASDIAIHAKEILRIRENLTQTYFKHCAKPGEDLSSGIDRFGKILKKFLEIFTQFRYQ
jgi:ATP-dependent protease ClpP protease subunit